jgi:hypothetical protein
MREVSLFSFFFLPHVLLLKNISAIKRVVQNEKWQFMWHRSFAKEGTVNMGAFFLKLLHHSSITFFSYRHIALSPYSLIALIAAATYDNPEGDGR